MYVCMYVCMSITGLHVRLKYAGLCIVYVLLACAAQDAMHNGMEIEVEDSEQCPNDSRCMEDG